MSKDAYYTLGFCLLLVVGCLVGIALGALLIIALRWAFAVAV